VAWPGLAWPGLASPGVAWPGLALPGVAWRGLAPWPGLGGPGLALTGLTWPGGAEPGRVGAPWGIGYMVSLADKKIGREETSVTIQVCSVSIKHWSRNLFGASVCLVPELLRRHSEGARLPPDSLATDQQRMSSSLLMECVAPNE